MPKNAVAYLIQPIVGSDQNQNQNQHQPGGGGTTEGTATRDPRGGACLLFWFMHEVDFVIDEETTETVTVRYGDCIAAPEVVAPEGYEFTGWYTDADCTEAFDLATKFRSDVIREVETLYAGFAPIAADETEDAE